MVCESWKTKLDTYLDGELTNEEMRVFDAHLRSCHYCSADALARVQMKRTIQVAGKHFTPSAEFRRRVQHRIAPKLQRSLPLGWMFVAVAVILVVGTLTSAYLRTRSRRDQVLLVSGRDSTPLLLHQGTMPDCGDSRCGERLAGGGTAGIEVGRCEIRSARIERDPPCFPSGRYSLQDRSF